MQAAFNERTLLLFVGVMLLNLAAGFLAGFLLLNRRNSPSKGHEHRTQEANRRLAGVENVIQTVTSRSQQFESDLDLASDRLERVAVVVDATVAEVVEELSRQATSFRQELHKSTEALLELRQPLRDDPHETVDRPQAVRGPHRSEDRASATELVADVAPVQAVREMPGPTQVVQSIESAQRRAEERRRHPRIAATVPLTVTPVNERSEPLAGSFDAMLRDISLGGLAFLHTRPVSHQLLQIEFDVPDGEHRTVILEVLRCEPIGRFYVIAGQFAH